MRLSTLLIILLLSASAHAQPESEYTGVMLRLNRSVTGSVCRNVLTITNYTSITGKPDSLVFHRAEGSDVLVFQWKADGYQALLTPVGQDSSFILRFDGDTSKWYWGCKSKMEFPSAMHWNVIPGDSTSYIVFAGSPRNNYERLLLLSYIGYCMRNDGVGVPLQAKKKKKKSWGSFHSLVRKGQKNWYFKSERIGKKIMSERLQGPIKRRVSSGTLAAGDMTVYRRK